MPSLPRVPGGHEVDGEGPSLAIGSVVCCSYYSMGSTITEVEGRRAGREIDGAKLEQASSD